MRLPVYAYLRDFPKWHIRLPSRQKSFKLEMVMLGLEVCSNSKVVYPKYRDFGLWSTTRWSSMLGHSLG